MQKIKNAIKGHRNKEEEYDTTYGATTGTYNEAATGVHTHEHGVTHHQTVDEVIEERPVAVGVAEVPVVVTEQERVSTQRVSEEVCGQKTFTEVEDRPIVKERVERILEHRPVEKQYVVETRFVGEREVAGAGAGEIVDVKERVVEVAQPGPTCPVNTGAVMNEVVAGMAGTTGVAQGTHHTHHTGHTHASDRIL